MSNDNKHPQYVVCVRLHVQVNSDYGTEPRMATRICNETTTIAEIVGWAKKLNALGRGDIVITAADGSDC